MRTDFVKMHGLGNDFIVLHAAAGSAPLEAARWRALADRHRGIGFDQALVIEPARRAGTQAYYRIFNADGAEVEQCGNGARCIAELLRLEGRAPDGSIAMECRGGLVRARFGAEGQVSVDMGEPLFTADALPFTTDRPGHRQSLVVDGETVSFGIVSMGNPHAVIDVADVASAPVERLGPPVESHQRFPRRVNVGFLQVVDRGHLRLRVYERGAGETQACGTGACAAMAVARLEDRVDECARVSLPGGELTIRWPGPGNSLWLEGPAEVSFRGNVEL